MTIDYSRPGGDLNTLAQQNYECATKCLKSALTSHEMAVQSADTLHEQGNQIKRVAGHLDTVHVTLDESEKKLDVINSLFGNVQNWFKSLSRKEPPKKTEQKQNEAPKAQFITRRHREQLQAEDEKQKQELLVYQKLDKQTDSIIDQIALAVEDIKQLSLHMGEELDRQNQDLREVHEDVDSAVPRLQRATRKAKSSMA